MYAPQGSCTAFVTVSTRCFFAGLWPYVVHSLKATSQFSFIFLSFTELTTHLKACFVTSKRPLQAYHSVVDCL